MDGSRFVPNIGVPVQVTTATLGYNGSLSSLTYSGGRSQYLVAGGNEIFSGSEKQTEIIASSRTKGDITSILSDLSRFFVIHSTGSIEAFDKAGKLLWKHEDTAFGVNPGNAILADTELIVAGQNTGVVNYETTGSNFLESFSTSSGAMISVSTDGAPYYSIIFDPKTHHILAASDSVINTHNMLGECSGYQVFQKRFNNPELRIISNLCLCGKNKDKLAFGYLAMKPGSDERAMYVGVFSNISGRLKQEYSHEVPYLPINIASNGPVILSSGFRDSGGDLESGIDAFYADDTTKLWQRRFTYPVIMPVAINEKYAYFTLTFSTQTAVPAQSIFYTLDLSTGKALGELAITGAQHGFASGIPMPLGEMGFMLVDASRPVIYFLKP